MGRARLPIDPHLPRACDALSRGNLVMVAPPGAGKTTRLPPALLEAGIAGGRRIAVLEPRRLAARAAAARVAAELGCSVGGAVGYEVRFDRRVGADTRIVFMTEGLLARRLTAGDGWLGELGVVVIDEFHERHLWGDLVLALVRRAQQRGSDVKLAVLSATLDPAPVAAFLGDCPVQVTEGRSFPVDIEHAEMPASERLEREVARAVGRVMRDGPDGHVLVFLPGAGEIRRAMEACAELAARRDLLLLPLHGGLGPAEQDRALAPSDRRKVVFATNVAESSLTIDGVVAVVDSGLARIARHAPWSGLGTLRVEPVSRASSAQRAGRAGRTGPGRCVRLYTRHDHDTRRDHDPPEVVRTDLAEAALALAAAGVEHGEPLAWFEPPPAEALAAAETLLRRLGAVDAAGRLTDIGRRMARFPLHPRQARVVVEAERRGVAELGCLAAAVLSDSKPRPAVSRSSPTAPANFSPPPPSDSDLLDEIDEIQRSRGRGHGHGRSSVRQVAERLSRLADRSRSGPADPLAREAELRVALLTGFPDRIARRRRPGQGELLLCDGAGGGAAVLDRASAVRDADLLVAIDAEERGRGRERRVVVRRASAIEAAWLYDLYLDDVVDADEVVFDRAARRVERVRRLEIDGLILEESRDADPRHIDPAAAGQVLAAAARAAGFAAFVDPAALERLRARAAFVARACPAAGVAPIEDRDLDHALGQAAASCTRFSELEQAGLLDQLQLARGTDARRTLDRLAPEYVALPGRRRVPVHYEPDRPPWIESRLQDFFSLSAGPAVAGGAVPLTLHLLAPNRRAVQVTTDLARFWEVHYPALRRQLMRRYPRHAWPEDPTGSRP